MTKERIAGESTKLLALKYFKDKFFLLEKTSMSSRLSKLDFIEYLSENDAPALDDDEDEPERPAFLEKSY
ncbi:MAG: hypothetical protein GY849_02045 [Deltaproteobacteria bacterium]|nr:hypothetical protein [Deltaproteobacteria bacterium]